MGKWGPVVDQILDELRLLGKRPDLRPVHAIGIGLTGSFLASPTARTYCIAEHFSGRRAVPVTVRFSNGSASARTHDGWSDVRGMATRFHLDGGAATDLVAMTLPIFFTQTPEAFLEFLETARPIPVRATSAWRKLLDLLQLVQPMPDPYPGERRSPAPGAIQYADTHASAQLAVLQAATIGAPVSYARAVYHAVHAFAIEGPDGVRRWVRFSWRPVTGARNTDPTKPPVEKYLADELRARIAREPARFTLMMAIGEAGDDPTDPSRPWPPNRRRVVLGELTLDKIPTDQIAHCEKLSFNPMLLTPGIEASSDPVLLVRGEAYSKSSQWRGGTACPFAGSSPDGK